MHLPASKIYEFGILTCLWQIHRDKQTLNIYSCRWLHCDNSSKARLIRHRFNLEKCHEAKENDISFGHMVSDSLLVKAGISSSSTSIASWDGTILCLPAAHQQYELNVVKVGHAPLQG